MLDRKQKRKIKKAIQQTKKAAANHNVPFREEKSVWATIGKYSAYGVVGVVIGVIVLIAGLLATLTAVSIADTLTADDVVPS